MRHGISGLVYDQIMSGVNLDPEVLIKDQYQPEVRQPIWKYLEKAVTDSRIQDGRAALLANKATLQRIASKYGVAQEFIVAIWGLESAYGKVLGDFPVIQSLATLANDARRAGLFETQLICALKIVQNGDISTNELRGSWAGAMGHTQFMPSSFLEHAIDFDSDGVRNIWGDDPCDALASTAAYLAAAGWLPGGQCLVEIQLTAEFDFALAGMNHTKPASEWRKFGVDMAQPSVETASILIPAGAKGPAFIAFANFKAILRYNAAIPYAIAIDQLAERIAGTKPIALNWPFQDQVMSVAEQRELQQRLTKLGMDTKGVDGIFGPNTFAALRRYQTKQGLVADGYPTREILMRLRE